MKTLLRNIVCIAALVGLTSCDKKSNDNHNIPENNTTFDSTVVDSDGNCTEYIILNFNSVKEEATRFEHTPNNSSVLTKRESEASLQKIQKSCDLIKNNLSDKSCKAKNLDDNSIEHVGYFRLKNLCEKVTELLKSVDAKTDESTKEADSARSSEPPTAVTPTPPVDESDPNKISDLTKGFIIEIKNPKIISELLSYEADGFIQNGKTIYGKENIDKNLDLCFLKKSESAYESLFNFNEGDLLHMFFVDSKLEKLAVLSLDTKITMGCIKFKSKTTWTLQDLKVVFGTSAVLTTLKSP